MALEQLVRLILVVGDLQGVSELGMILARLQAPADAADSGQQQDSAGRDAEDGGAHDEAHGPRLARGRLNAVHVPGVLLVEEQAVKVGADRLIGGGQPGGERGSRPGRHARRAEQIADGGPLPDQPRDAGPLGARVVGVQPLQGVEPGAGRREKAGVQEAEEP